MTYVSELIDLGPCPTCHQARWLERICTCGDSVIAHTFGTRRGETVRTACTRHGCGCKIFEEVAGG